MEALVGASVGFAAYKYHKHGEKMRNLAEYDYTTAPLASVLSMLIHGVYFRDLPKVGAVAATFLGYQDGRAENYHKRHWQPYRPHQVTTTIAMEETELHNLGLEFYLRKDPHPNQTAPHLAIVLRGTIPIKSKDLAADWKIARERLDPDKTSRVLRSKTLIAAVVKEFRREFRGHEDQRICLTGHSLGAAIALMVGSFLVCFENTRIDTHLFHPPLLTLVDIAMLKPFPKPAAVGSQSIFSNSRDELVTIWLALCMGDAAVLEEEWRRFVSLENWVPHFYLNPDDAICKEYIEYYTERHRMVTKPSHITSLQGMLTRLIGKDARYILNVVPSADLHISHYKSRNPLMADLKAHSLRQWHKYIDEAQIEHFRARLIPRMAVPDYRQHQ